MVADVKGRARAGSVHLCWENFDIDLYNECLARAAGLCYSARFLGYGLNSKQVCHAAFLKLANDLAAGTVPDMPFFAAFIVRLDSCAKDAARKAKVARRRAPVSRRGDGGRGCKESEGGVAATVPGDALKFAEILTAAERLAILRAEQKKPRVALDAWRKYVANGYKWEKGETNAVREGARRFVEKIQEIIGDETLAEYRSMGRNELARALELLVLINPRTDTVPVPSTDGEA